MNCRECGHATRVAETRTDEDGIIIRRRRVCTDDACGKRFWTLEIDDMVAGTIIGRAMATHKDAVLRRRARGQRNKQIVSRLLNGEAVGDLAKELGVAQSTISRAGNAAGVYSRGQYRRG